MTDRTRITRALVGEWAAIRDLAGDLDPEQWDRHTCLPGWNVFDQVAHVLATEMMLAGEPTPELLQDAPIDHIRNDIGRVNEAFVVDLRRLDPDGLLARYDEITGDRAATLGAMSDDEWDAPSWTPAGQATYGRFMQIRVFDCWMHEQDIRAAIDRPGNTSGDAAEVALDEVLLAAGYVVGKKAGAPDGSSVTITMLNPVDRTVHVVVDGKAKVVEQLDEPADATVTMTSDLFMRLSGGRVDPETVLDQISLGGDTALARQVATHLAYTI